ncbi:MAG: hypothetical protein PHO63_06250 [Bacilli bacterium]|nr:hypothetical protein [Bacilli bacterium]
MAFISPVFILILIGIPSIVYLLIKKSVEANKKGDTAKQWFYIWFIVIITLFLFVLLLSSI